MSFIAWFLFAALIFFWLRTKWSSWTTGWLVLRQNVVDKTWSRQNVVGQNVVEKTGSRQNMVEQNVVGQNADRQNVVEKNAERHNVVGIIAVLLWGCVQGFESSITWSILSFIKLYSFVIYTYNLLYRFTLRHLGLLTELRAPQAKICKN